MAQKVINLPDIGPVVFQKRAGSRSLRLHIQGSRVKVTLPNRVPYAVAQKFVLGRKQWVLDNLEPRSEILDGAYIGKNHHVLVQEKPVSRPSSRVTDTEIRVTLPMGLTQASSEAQRVITRACEKALLHETETLIVPRLNDLAFEHGFTVRSVTVKRLRSRWGSCDAQQNITLNSYLTQLPWPLIDYVLVHELAHTKHLNHSPAFWDEVGAVLRDYNERRKATKSYSPHVITT
jgi:predicted metal-dependent hydrolase